MRVINDLTKTRGGGQVFLEKNKHLGRLKKCTRTRKQKQTPVKCVHADKFTHIYSYSIKIYIYIWARKRLKAKGFFESGRGADA